MKCWTLVIAVAAVALQCDRQEPMTDEAGLTLSKAMGAVQGEDFDKALEPHQFGFPEDHGPHPRFRTEWWYLTGNLTTKEGKGFGYQFTIFRTALTREQVQRPSAWASNQIYMAHLAVTDIDGNKFYYDERFSRGGNRLAGAQASPLRIWLEDWEMRQSEPTVAYDLPVLKVEAKGENAGIDLVLKALKPFVLQGEAGLSQNGPEAGDASYYYSYTRLGTRGTITVNGKDWAVSGTSWMDREWSTSALSSDQIGWDWFALQLDDNTELMYYQMRKKSGAPDVFSKGILVHKDGSEASFARDDVILSVTDTWVSPSGAVYPSGWRLKVPGKGIDFAIVPALRDQLLDVSIDYWEGSVTIEGSRDGSKVLGRGYVELTGY